MADFLIQSLITLMVIINPFAAVPIFASLTQQDSYETKKIVAKRSCIISLFLLLLFAMIGDFLLRSMNISEAAFRIAGGFLLFLSAIDMVRSKPDLKSLRPDNNETSVKSNARLNDISVFPLAIPFLAGPGAITSTVILMRQAQNIHIYAQIGLLLILVFMIGFTYSCLLVSDRILKLFGVTGSNVLTRVFGIVLSALCVQSMLNGFLDAFFHHH